MGGRRLEAGKALGRHHQHRRYRHRLNACQTNCHHVRTRANSMPGVSRLGTTHVRADQKQSLQGVWAKNVAAECCDPESLVNGYF